MFAQTNEWVGKISTNNVSVKGLASRRYNVSQNSVIRKQTSQ